MFPFSHNPVLVPVLRRLAQGIIDANKKYGKP